MHGFPVHLTDYLLGALTLLLYMKVPDYYQFARLLQPHSLVNQGQLMLGQMIPSDDMCCDQCVSGRASIDQGFIQLKRCQKRSKRGLCLSLCSICDPLRHSDPTLNLKQHEERTACLPGSDHILFHSSRVCRHRKSEQVPLR